MDSCSSSTNLDQSISTIYVSPEFECIDHVSSSHVTAVTRVATVVVKTALVPSAEHVSWESSRLTEVKLQEHW